MSRIKQSFYFFFNDSTGSLRNKPQHLTLSSDFDILLLIQLFLSRKGERIFHARTEVALLPAITNHY